MIDKLANMLSILKEFSILNTDEGMQFQADLEEFYKNFKNNFWGLEAIKQYNNGYDYFAHIFQF